MSLYPQFARPRSLAQATSLLSSLANGGTIIAGGQELMPHMNYGRLEPEVLIDIGALAELKAIKLDDGVLALGALTSHREIQRNEQIVTALPILAHAATHIGGGWQVHNRGTIGGNIVAAHPLYDIVPPLLVADANITLCDSDGTRSMRLDELLRNPHHGLGSTAILVRIEVPITSETTGWGYEKLKLTQGSYASANAAALVELDTNKHTTKIRLALGAVTEIPILLTDELASCVGQPVDESALEFIADQCVAAVANPLDDQRGDGEYRRAMAGVVGRRAAMAAVSRMLEFMDQPEK